MSLQSDIQSAIALAQQGNHKAALKAAKSGMKRNKTHPLLPNIAAIALSAMGKERDAIPYFQKALSLDPAFHDARRNLGIALTATGQHEKAAKVLEKAVASQPGDAAAWTCLATARRGLGALEEAKAAAQQAAELAPGDMQARRSLAEILEDLGEINAAIAQLEELRRIAPFDLPVLYALAELYIYQTRHGDALELLRHAAELEPANADALYRLAAQLLAMGQRDEAGRWLAAILEIDPGHSNALEQLALIQTPEQNAALRPQVEQALAAAPRQSLQQATLRFGLAHIARRSGDAALAAPLYAKANAAVTSLSPYDRKQQEALNREAISRFPAPVEPVSAAVSGPRPFFVTGLPRSGTTLTEAVLAAHPAVAALGERRIDNLMVAALETGGQLAAPELERLASVTRGNLPDLPQGTTAYVDKMPENHRFIGILHAAFPDAVFVNLRRDPRDTALSQWHTLFSQGAIPYAYDQRAMAHRFNLYAEIMNHWHRVLPGVVLDLAYEDLVADVEAGSKQLAEHCGLDWDPVMAAPHRSVAQVLTASRDQVRQPVHAKSVGKWEQHRDELSPFLEGLDPELWPGLR